jgi:biopolymer transport protein ExbD
MFQRQKQTEVEMQITPMLDMAFQLLTFFILTYRPSPTEGQFAMSLLPPSPATPVDAAPADSNPASSDVPALLRTLTTTLRADAAGHLARITLGENDLAGVDQLKAQLKAIQEDKTLPFDQALIQADPDLKYEELMRVVDVFSKLNITKISFSELDANASGAGGGP